MYNYIVLKKIKCEEKVMKKLLALLLTLAMMLALVACVKPDNKPDGGNTPDGGSTEQPDQGGEKTPDDELAVMSYEEYMAAEVDDEVLVEVYVQAHQSWWDNKITVYAADEDGGYFIYNMACSEDDAAKLTAGTKIKVHGYKTIWEGEIEIIDATFEFVEGDGYVAEAIDITDELGSETLVDYQNQLVSFSGLTVVEVEYQGGNPGKDIYLTVSLDGAEYSFCVESYLTFPDSDLYKAVGELEAGDVINVEGFLYWYNGANPHITSMTLVGPMTYDEYIAAPIDAEVIVEAYVQAHQSWWDNKNTVYAADENGGYFLYNMACSEEDAAKLLPGTKIRVHGYKAEWSGEIEIVDATFEFVEADSYVAEAKDATDLLGTDNLINYQNQLVSFSGLTVVSTEYQNGSRGKDIYVTVSLDGAEYDFCVESYLTSPDSDLYVAVEALKAGDVVDIEGFLYWYNGVNTHITGVTVK